MFQLGKRRQAWVPAQDGLVHVYERHVIYTDFDVDDPMGSGGILTT
jgi:hypothetical protein